MGQFFDTIPENLIEWIKKQKMFWVASAPLTADGHINVSPKGMEDSFHIINPNKVWYEDLTGSGVETISHLRENGRITVMFTAFDGPPRIVRLFGKGTVHEFGTPEYDALIPKEVRKPGSRSAIVIDVYKVGSSCGYSVPYYDFKAERTTLLDYAKRKEDADAAVEAGEPGAKADRGLRAYWMTTNKKSLDGLPGVLTAHQTPYAPKSLLTWESGTPGGNVKGAAQLRKAAGVAGSENVKILLAFSLGILVAAAFAKLAGAA